jgi:hypothetical protein
MHEQMIEAITFPIRQAMLAMQAERRDLGHRFQLLMNTQVEYDQYHIRKGYYKPDASLQMDNEEVLVLEVSFSQKWEEVRSKMGKILKYKLPIVTAIAIDIVETPRYKGPSSESKPDDFIQDFMQQAQGIQSDHPLSSIAINGHTWMGSVQIYISIFEHGWRVTDDDPIKVGAIVGPHN